MGMLNRYLQGKREEINKLKKKRPYLVSEVKKLNEADKWRYQLLKDIAKKMGEIQNRGLGEHKIRKLNDEINLLFREKIHWERRIQELGGPNYTNLTKTTKSNAKSNKITDSELRYRYFGAARNLPGVKELYENETPRFIRKSSCLIQQNLVVDYYNFRDENDDKLTRKEIEAEYKMRL